MPYLLTYFISKCILACFYHENYDKCELESWKLKLLERYVVISVIMVGYILNIVIDLN